MGKEKTEKVYTNPVRCKGCGYCINACPQEAISVSDHVNAKGYNTIVVDEEKCVAWKFRYLFQRDQGLGSRNTGNFLNL